MSFLAHVKWLRRRLDGKLSLRGCQLVHLCDRQQSKRTSRTKKRPRFICTLLNQQPSSLIIHQTIQSSTSESTALITYNPTNSKKLSSIYQAIQSSTSESTALIAFNPTNRSYQIQSSTSESTALVAFNPTNSKKLSSIYQAIQSSTSESTALITYNPSNNSIIHF
ncbi:uncharacterized protein LOC113390652 [Ctenocephalides felis]|uniref:uncharacterized protein LOC113390652 n=1 Tax=Ctenocephalides felis TaxID=7515 RepID=UPI000E6E165E|nr:uncharacterized protein LOC113390652 [Ctenocephalides felis]